MGDPNIINFSEQSRLNHENKRKEIWMNAWCATANANDCKTSGVATAWADRALEDFDKRFKL